MSRESLQIIGCRKVAASFCIYICPSSLFWGIHCVSRVGMWLEKALPASSANPSSSPPHALIRDHSTTRHKPIKLQQATEGRKCTHPPCDLDMGKTSDHSKCHLPSPVLASLCLSAAFWLLAIFAGFTHTGLPPGDTFRPWPSKSVVYNLPKSKCWRTVSLVFFGPVVHPQEAEIPSSSRPKEGQQVEGKEMTHGRND